MNKQDSEKLLALKEEYDFIDDSIYHMVASLLKKRDRLFEIAMQMKVIVSEDKIKLTSEECENTGSVAGGESASDLKEEKQYDRRIG